MPLFSKRFFVFLAFLWLLIAPQLGYTHGSQDSILSTEAVQKILDAAVKEAMRTGIPMSIAVVNSEGNLVGFIRMQGTRLHGRYTSESKAYTSASTCKPSHETGIPKEVEQEISAATDGRYVNIPGGRPIMVSGKCIGAIGVSGGNGEQDVEVAKAGLRALQ